MCTNEKAKQTFLQQRPVPVGHVVKSPKVVTIPVLMLKTFNLKRFVCSDIHLIRSSSLGNSLVH